MAHRLRAPATHKRMASTPAPPPTPLRIAPRLRPKAHRTEATVVGGAAALLLAAGALRRWAEYSAQSAEERVMRQLELQRRAEELASVRSVSTRAACGEGW
jgi:hypothetical protein